MSDRAEAANLLQLKCRHSAKTMQVSVTQADSAKIAIDPQRMSEKRCLIWIADPNPPAWCASMVGKQRRERIRCLEKVLYLGKPQERTFR
jgi:hypothetical protein